jgi:arylsulfatase A
MRVREFAFDQRFKLYRSGEFFDLKQDVAEKRPLAVASLQGDPAAAAKQLQSALDKFKNARPARFDRAFEKTIKGQKQKKRKAR